MHRHIHIGAWVAPFTGAWIEIKLDIYTPPMIGVAPFTGAWIEIKLDIYTPPMIGVAPFTGAWIGPMSSLSTS